MCLYMCIYLRYIILKYIIILIYIFKVRNILKNTIGILLSSIIYDIIYRERFYERA